MQQALLEIGIDQLMPDPTQPRKTFLDEEIQRLATSLKARGVLLPLRVMRDEERKCWRIVTGECRWRAARMAGLKTLPCLPVAGEISETEILADQIVENAVRHALRPLELAHAMAKLKALKKCTSQTLATELGLSGSAITRAEGLLLLPPDVQQMVDDGRVPESAGYELSRMPDVEMQRELAHAIAAGKLSRDSLQEAVRKVVGKRQKTPTGERLTYRLDSGVCVTVSRPGQVVTKADLQAAIARLREEMKKLDSEELADFARAS
jgi:ParB family chromosome partitioning protein